MPSDNNYEYYKVLQCSRDSSQDEIKRAYHRLALIHHPDKNSANSEKFLEIEEAWRILSQPNSRRKYDAECRQAELESENILIHERISLKDLKTEDQKLSFPCRCGNNYLINKDDFNNDDETVYIPCQECTFFIAIDR
ncbi:dnaJ homolog subfamily C member 24-like [Fopius arisanus]|uniref:DnaJ homolog subfamily C member 24-like n=1 Tax=Fopius arisanus TaxID=64838 RepID=A0A9R1TR75_9HYME|nr:PREDICTED: dnaJ homolog subfamily C member 24-like [Fopius arisanus]